MRMFGIWASGLLAALLGGAAIGAVAGVLCFEPRIFDYEREVYEVFLGTAAALALICAWLGQSS